MFFFATIFSFSISDFHVWNHFIIKETLPSVALVLGISGVLAFNFTLKPSNKTALFLLLGIVTPLVSNIGTSLMVLPMLMGSTSYLFEEYGKMRGLLILLIVGMMSANTLAVFTAQADLPTTAYMADLKDAMPYTQGKSPFGVLIPIGSIAYIGYLSILILIGVKPKLKEIKEVRFSVENPISLFISVSLCLFFIFAMNKNIWWYYLLGPVLAFVLALIQYSIEYKQSKDKKRFKISSANNVRELSNIYRETILMFFCIFALIQCLPLSEIGGNKIATISATIVETLFSDNLIAFQANKHIGYQISWDFGTQYVLLSSILYGAHFVMGHVVLIFFFLNFLSKDWNKTEIITEEEEIDLMTLNDNLSPIEYKYEKIILKKFMLVSLALLPLTISMQISMTYGLWVIGLGIVLTLCSVRVVMKKFFN